MNPRELVKLFARGAGFALALPSLTSFWIRSSVMGRDRALEGSSHTLSLIPGVLGQYVRRGFYSVALDHCHHSVTIEFGVLFSKAGARLDEQVYIGPRCHLGLVHIERNVLLGPCVHIPSGASTHGTGDPDLPIRDQPGQRRLVRIGAGSWIGSNAVVMADIGKDVVVGAGAVVTSTLPDRVMAGGVPARVIKSRESAARLSGPS